MAQDKSLYQLVHQGLKDSVNKGKTPIGYTVGSYKGVLQALRKAKVVYKEVLSQTANIANVNTSTISYTKLTQLGIGGIEDQNGFIDIGSEPSYQAHCELKDYMSFMLDIDTQNGSLRDYVSVQKPTPDSHAAKGHTLSSGNNIVFPPAINLLADDTFKKLCQGVGGESQPLKIGIGISTRYLGVNFFKHFFPENDADWAQKNVETIAGKGWLKAEVLLPTSKSNARVLHTQVTVCHESATPPVVRDEETGEVKAKYQAWLPIPLLLLNDFKSLAKIQVKTGNASGASFVGEDGVSFPLANNHYSHVNATIQGFTPKFLKPYLKGSGQKYILYSGASLCNKGVSTKARIRLYLSRNATEFVIRNVLHGKEMPEKWQKQLFNGQASPDSITETVEIVGRLADVSIDVMNYLRAVANEIGSGMTAELLMKFITCVGYWETGAVNGWDFWGIVGGGRKGTDGAGYNAGIFSLTQAHGGIHNLFVEIQKALGSENQYYNDLTQMINRAKLSNDDKCFYSLQESDGEKYKEIYAKYPTEVQVSNLKAWFEYYYGTRFKNGLKQFNYKSILGLASLQAFVNWRPSKFIQYISAAGVQDESDQVHKIELTGAAWIGVAMKQVGKIDYQDVIKQVKAEKGKEPRYHTNKYARAIHAGAHGGWYNRSANLINNAHDLDARNVKALGYD